MPCRKYNNLYQRNDQVSFKYCSHRHSPKRYAYVLQAILFKQRSYLFGQSIKIKIQSYWMVMGRRASCGPACKDSVKCNLAAVPVWPVKSHDRNLSNKSFYQWTWLFEQRGHDIKTSDGGLCRPTIILGDQFPVPQSAITCAMKYFRR